MLAVEHVALQHTVHAANSMQCMNGLIAFMVAPPETLLENNVFWQRNT